MARTMRSVPYRDYFVVVNPSDKPEGRLKDSFSIHKLREGSVDWTVTVYSYPLDRAMSYETEDEAIENALKHAGAWIDGQYEQQQP